MFEAIIFYIFATILVLSAFAVITSRNPVHAALFLVLVYVGAVMVLFLFVVMMLDINLDKLREGFWRYLPVGAAVGIVIAAEMGLLVWAHFKRGSFPTPAEVPLDYSNTKELGRVLYTDYVYPFELAAVLLLVAIIAAIALTMRRRKDTKYQNPGQQVQVRRQDRVRMVSMPAEPKE